MKKSNELKRLVAAAGIILSALAMPANALVTGVNVSLSSDGTSGWDPASGTGFDTAPNNQIVRTNDSFEYLLTIGTSGSDNNLTFTATLPSGTVAPRIGQSVARWSYVPIQCSGAGSAISANGQTLTCNLGNFASSSTLSVYLNATVLGTTPNGTPLTSPAISSTSSAGAGPAPTTAAATVNVTAAPFYDTVVRMSFNGTPKAYGFWAASGPANEDGFYHRPLIGLVARNPNGNGAKGVEQLDPAVPIDFILNTSGYPSTVLVDNWHTGTGSAGTPAATGSFLDGCGSPNTGAPSVESGNFINMYSFVGDSGAVNATTSYVYNGGDCAVTASSASSVSLRLTGTDTTFARRPTVTVSAGTAVPAAEWWMANKALVLWTPISSYAPSATVNHTLSLTSVTATSISGQPITGNVTTNDSLSYGLQNVNTGSGSHVFAAYTVPVIPYATQCDPAVPADCLTNFMTPGQRVSQRTGYANTGSQAQSNVYICSVIDRTAFDLGPNISASITDTAGWTIRYGSRAAGPYFASTDSATDPTASSTAVSSDHSNANCNDSTITWHSTPAAAEAAGGLVFVRADRPVVDGGTRSTLYVFDLLLRSTYAATIAVNGPTPAVRTVGTPIVNGTILRTVGKVGGTLTPMDTAYLVDHLQVVEAKNTTRVSKTVTVPADISSPLPSGSLVTYALQPRFSTRFPPSPHTVTVTDVLPPNIVYVAASATVGGTPQEPAISLNTPAAGYTTLVWTLPNQTPYLGADTTAANLPSISFQARLSATAPNGTVVTNSAAASGGADDYEADCAYSTSTNTFGTCLKAASINVTIQTPPGFRVEKTVLDPVVEPGGTFRFQLGYASLGQDMSGSEIPDLIDILPFVGDGTANPTMNIGARTPGTAIAAGGYVLQSVTVPSNDPGMTVLYTSRVPSSINLDPRDASNAIPSGATLWCTLGQFGSAGCPATIAAATAVRLQPNVSTLPANTLYVLTLTAGTVPGIVRPGNILANSVGARSPDTGASLLLVEAQANGPVRVVSSGLSGSVFSDENQNNTIDGTDAGIAGVCIVLTGTVPNVGTVTYSTLTAANGTYGFVAGAANTVFTNGTCTGTAEADFLGLLSGTYSVSQPAQPSGFNDGADYAGTGGGTVAADVINTITIGRDVALTAYNFTEMVPKLANLRVTKTNTAGSNGDVDLAGDTVASGSTITYVIRVTNDGPSAVTGTVVRDTIGADITCPATNAVSLAGDGVPPGSYRVSDLTGAGVVLGELLANQSTTLSFACTVN